MTTQTELDFRRAGGGISQNQRLADYLRANPGRWLPMPQLARILTPTGIGVPVHSRVADCRAKFGMTIHQRGHKDPLTGAYHSEYYFQDHGTPHPDTTAHSG